jgi:hypothetical protein
MSDTTYTLPSLADYQAASGPDKVRMRTAAERAMREALASDEFATAKEINSALSTWAPAKAAKVFIDWNGLVAVRVASLRELADRIESNEVTLAGVPEGFSYTVADGEADEASITRLAGVRVGNSKAAASDLQAAFDEVFEGRESGDFLTCQEITNLAGLPSSGAVAARLFATSGCTLTGVTPVPATATTPRGARKV